ARGVLVHEPDRGAGEDVVELLQEQQAPQASELVAWVLAAARDREQLRVPQPLLRAPVAPLDERLCRVRAAVLLEAELADAARPLGGLGFEGAEERRGRGLARARRSLQVARATERLDHLGRRAAAAVAVAIDEERRLRALGGAVVARCPQQLRDVRRRVVGVG